MVASSLKDSTESLIEIRTMPKVKALPAAVIFGPNASGKSNMIAAFARFKNLVLESHRKGKPSGGIRHNPFALNSTFAEQPTCFEADLIIEGVRYQYGFAFNEEAFQQEWLYSYPEGTKRKLFERVGPKSGDLIFGASLKGKKHVIAELMRPNSLYLSTAAQNKHEQLTKISSFFETIDFNIEFSVSTNQIKTRSYVNEKDIDSRVIEFLKICQTGVIGYRKTISEKDHEFERISNIFFETMTRIQKDEDKNGNSAKIEFDKSLYEIYYQNIDLEHSSEHGSTYLNLDQESAGTKRLLALLDDVFDAIDNGSLILVDEIDASLHTQVCEAILYLFADKRINKKGAQIIATTHDTNLLRSATLRRDQVWLVEKNAHGASEFYSLADIKTRPGDNFELGYMQGRYGAVPFTEPVAELFSSLAE